MKERCIFMPAALALAITIGSLFLQQPSEAFVVVPDCNNHHHASNNHPAAAAASVRFFQTTSTDSKQQPDSKRLLRYYYDPNQPLFFGNVGRSRSRRRRSGRRQASSTSTTMLWMMHPVASLGQRLMTHRAAAIIRTKQWKTLAMIPILAGLVGWFTNYLAVQMIFYPIAWRGIPLKRKEGEPLGLFGWQGIVPAKTQTMSESMVNATITQLLSMEEMIRRIDPSRVANLLLPQTDAILTPIVQDLTAELLPWMRSAVTTVVVETKSDWQQRIRFRFLQNLTRSVQDNIGRVLSLRNCVVEQMMADRSLLGKLFQISGKKELAFLTDSGLWFGFVLGIIQLIVAVVWDNPWTMSVGGLVVGLATNWLALKWIFQPVHPTRVGPFCFQGLFLRRQAEVSADFSNFFATQILTSEQIWQSILTDPTTAPAFSAIFADNFAQIVREESGGLVDLKRDAPEQLHAASKKATQALPQYLADLHPYIDDVLDIERTLGTRMLAMTSQQFERVLHPIFEQDELTLILAGGGLGLAAGLVQQALATGALVLVPRRALGRTAQAVVTSTMVASCLLLYRLLKPGERMGWFKRELLKRVRDPKWAFYAIDLDRDGVLDQKDVRHGAYAVLGKRYRAWDSVALDDIFENWDEDKDGYVSLQEFQNWWARTEQDEGFRRKLVRGLGQEQTQLPDSKDGDLIRWRTIRLRNGRDVRLVWENRRVLLRRLRDSAY